MKHNSVVYSICSDYSSYLKLVDQESVIVRGVRTDRQKREYRREGARVMYDETDLNESRRLDRR